MPNCNLRDRFFYQYLTLMKDSYNVNVCDLFTAACTFIQVIQLFFNKQFTLGCCYFQLGIMALGFVRSTVELLTCGRGITPVRGFHQLTCPLLYRLALMLVFGLCVWKWTSSVTTLDPNQNFLMVLQVVLLRAWHVQGNLVNAEVQRDCAV